MSESKDYKALRRNMPAPRDRLNRVENIVGVGMPDINYCAAGMECWIEQKSPTEPKRETTPLFGSNHKLSQDQLNWFLDQRTAGGRAFVLICTDKRWLLMDGWDADHINRMTVDELITRAVWWSPYPFRDKSKWKELRECLINA